MVARQEGQRKTLRRTPYGNREKSENVMCWCTLSIEVTEGRNLSTVKCHKCKELFHSICAGFSDGTVLLDEHYFCPNCCKTPSIPKVFLEPFREQAKLKTLRKSKILISV